jgi:hypothetical protein
VTVIDAVPDADPLVAVIVAAPAPSAVTTPVGETVATADALVLQVTGRPVSTLPPASLSVAVRGVVSPTTKLDDAGVTATVATAAAVTVTLAVPDAAPLVAVIVAVPGATAVTTPVVDTVATVNALEFHVTARPVSTLPAASFSVAVNGAVLPTTMLALLGARVTVATGARATLTVAVPLFRHWSP